MLRLPAIPVACCVSDYPPCDFILLQAFASLSLLQAFASLSLLHHPLSIGVTTNAVNFCAAVLHLCRTHRPKPHVVPNTGYRQPINYNTMSRHSDTAPEPPSMGVCFIQG